MAPSLRKQTPSLNQSSAMKTRGEKALAKITSIIEGMRGYDREKVDQVHEILEEAEQEALDHDEITGCMYQEQVADNYAYYIVVETSEGWARLEPIPVLDGYRSQLVELMDRHVPVFAMKRHVKARQKRKRYLSQL